MILLVGVALVAALIARHSASRADGRRLAFIAGLALGLRVLAVDIIYVIAIRVHPEGVWLNDEASYFLATESLMPWPWDKALPTGLDHLGGNGYLGLTTTLSQFGGVSSVVFRDANAIFGTLVVVLCALLAHSLFGRTAGLVAGLATAVWPDLVLWSATMLRDTLGSLAVVSVWWALQTTSRERRVVTVCMVFLAVVLLATLRTYLAVAVGLGASLWLIYPYVQRIRPRSLVLGGVGVLMVGTVLAALQGRRIDAAEHELFYRQTVTRMETLGRLYRDPPPADEPIQLPFRPGVAIALTDPRTGWLLPGLVQDSATPGLVTVGLTDDTTRAVPISDLILLQDAPIPPLQLFSWVAPSMLSVFAGLPATSEEPNAAWIAAALAWDILLALAALGLLRGRLGTRNWMYPLCVIAGTVAALSAIPGSPGNAERHRATQTLPLLMVFASGLVSSPWRAGVPLGRPIGRPTSRPSSAITAVASSRRSAR